MDLLGRERKGRDADEANGRQCDYYIYVATEKVVPLNWQLRRNALSPETIKWGLWSVAVSDHAT